MELTSQHEVPDAEAADGDGAEEADGFRKSIELSGVVRAMLGDPLSGHLRARLQSD